MARFNPSTYDPKDDSSSGAAAKFGVPADQLVLVSSETTCQCGCGDSRDPKRSFRPGHDARLKGSLGRALATNTKVTFIKTEKGTQPDSKTVTAAGAIKAFGWSDIVKPAASSVSKNGSAPAKKAVKASKRTRKSAKA